jgi:hypothetical protein
MTLISRVDRETRSSRDVRSDDSINIQRSSRHRNLLLDTSIDSIVLISNFDALDVFVIFVAFLAFVTFVTSLAFVAFANFVVFDVILDVLSTFVLNALVSNAAFFERRHENSNYFRCVKIEVSCKSRKNVIYRRCTRQKNICVSIKHQCTNQLQLMINLSKFSRDFVARFINSLNSLVETSSRI